MKKETIHNFDPNLIVGLEHIDALKIAKENGYSVRLVEKDGKPLVCTRDYKTNRINVVVKGTKVVNADIG